MCRVVTVVAIGSYGFNRLDGAEPASQARVQGSLKPRCHDLVHNRRGEKIEHTMRCYAPHSGDNVDSSAKT